ncbi:MAG: hypothetical protein AAFR19_20645, partial [Pseudomonadota bacterium]
ALRARNSRRTRPRRSPARNLDTVHLLAGPGANVYDILKNETLVLTRAGLAAIEARFAAKPAPAEETA